MSLKRTDKPNNNGAPAEAQETPQYRNNVAVDAKIDSYIKANPKDWAYIQGLPRERLERAMVLQNVNKLERRERVRTAVMRKLDDNPELKEAYRTLVKHLPADQQERAMTSIAARTLRSVTPTTPARGVSAGV